MAYKSIVAKRAYESKRIRRGLCHDCSRPAVNASRCARHIQMRMAVDRRYKLKNPVRALNTNIITGVIRRIRQDSLIREQPTYCFSHGVVSTATPI
jgi:hypothetical protein